MAKFRSKVIEIEAVQFTGENYEDVQELAHNGRHPLFFQVDEEDRGEDPEIIAQVYDKLHSTWVGVKKDQWIIKGLKGEFYPCDNEVFEAKYEPVGSG